MKRIHTLTPEQQIFAEKQHNLIYSFLSRKHLNEAEFYDVVVFGFLQAVQEYLERPELSYLSFSTVAWRKMNDCLVDEYKYRNRLKRNAPQGNYHEEYETARLDQYLPARVNAIAEIMDNENRLLSILSYLTPKETTVIYLKADGYTHREIAEKLNVSSSTVSHRLHNLRVRLRELSLI